MCSLSQVEAHKVGNTKDRRQLVNLKVCLVDVRDGGVVVKNMVESSVVTEVKRKET